MPGDLPRSDPTWLPEFCPSISSAAETSMWWMVTYSVPAATQEFARTALRFLFYILRLARGVGCLGITQDTVPLQCLCKPC
jgi:hypothetical protein